MTTRFETISFSITDLIGKVRDIALEHPKTVYTKEQEVDHGERTWCSYATGHSSGVGDGCMFGQILPRDFVELDPQVNIEEALGVDHMELPDDQLLSDEVDDDGDKLPSQEMDWISKVQSQQDQGVTWADAVKQADINYPLD